MTHPTVTAPSILTVGLDVGDRLTHVCVLDPERRVVERDRLATSEAALRRRFEGTAACRIVLEVGSQSPWMSALLRSLGHEVLVADARRVSLISKSHRKTDRRDAETLARMMAGMPELLGSVHHRGPQAQADLAIIRARDLLVRMRTRGVQHVRGTLKAFGLRVRSCSASSFQRVARESVPELLMPALGFVLDQLADLERRIREMDRAILRVTAERYPEARRLQEINGVGPLTSLAFVLTLDDPSRFAKSRTVGSWLGLCPRVQSSGDKDPQLAISKTGCGYMRRILVQAAHYILGPFGKDSNLRRYGGRIAERGGKATKGRAVVAVARKLAVLMHRLLVSGQPYEPLRHAKNAAA
jgi:transposase